VARFKITIEYAGTRYSGWQKQKNARTIQGEIEQAIAAVTRQREFEFQGSGRTDAGVHALHQVAHLDIRRAPPTETLRREVNDALPADINLLAVESASPRFHARHAAVARSYLYQIARRRSAFAKPYVWWVKDPLDLGLMRAAGASFTGMHDFRAFSDDDPEEKSTDVLIDGLELGAAGALILVRVTGSHFLWKMVRRMVGVLVEAGRGGLPPAQVTALLQGRTAPGSGPTVAELTAPASGLFLERVLYDGDRRDRPLTPATFALTEFDSPAPPSARRSAVLPGSGAR
jgi:tRNA pseudouridine38-40 synthase